MTQFENEQKIALELDWIDKIFYWVFVPILVLAYMGLAGYGVYEFLAYLTEKG